MLYNTPLGLAYYDPLLGVNLWPATGLLTGTGLPKPLTLPVNYATLPITSSTWLTTNVPLGNSALIAYLKTIAPAGPPAVPGPPPVPVFLTPSAII